MRVVDGRPYVVQYQNCSISYNNSYRHLLAEIVDQTSL